MNEIIYSFEELDSLLNDIQDVKELNEKGIFYIRVDEEDTSRLYLPCKDGVAVLVFVSPFDVVTGKRICDKVDEIIDFYLAEEDDYSSLRELLQSYQQKIKNIEKIISYQKIESQND